MSVKKFLVKKIHILLHEPRRKLLLHIVGEDKATTTKVSVDSRLRPWCTTHDEYSVFIAEQTLVGIDTVDSAVIIRYPNASPLSYGWPKSKGILKHDFAHFRWTEQHANGYVWLARHDFLLVFYSDFRSIGEPLSSYIGLSIHKTHRSSHYVKTWHHQQNWKYIGLTYRKAVKGITSYG